MLLTVRAARPAGPRRPHSVSLTRRADRGEFRPTGPGPTGSRPGTGSSTPGVATSTTSGMRGSRSLPAALLRRRCRKLSTLPRPPAQDKCRCANRQGSDGPDPRRPRRSASPCGRAQLVGCRSEIPVHQPRGVGGGRFAASHRNAPFERALVSPVRRAIGELLGLRQAEPVRVGTVDRGQRLRALRHSRSRPRRPSCRGRDVSADNRLGPR